MDPAQAPAGGLPWVIAIPAIVFLAGLLVGVSKWAAAKVEQARNDGEARVTKASEAKEAMRSEYQALLEKCERRADVLEKEFREHLDRSIHILACARAAKTSTCGRGSQ